MRRTFINGRFLTQQTTGVQRFAREIVRALDTLLAVEGSRQTGKIVLLIPPGAERPERLQVIESRTVGVLRGQAWEQFELPWYTRGGISLNLCNTAPLAGRSTVVAIHDAGVFAVPSAYSRAFRLWYRQLHPQLGRRAVRTVTVSEFSRGELVRYIGIAPDRVTVIPNGGEHILAQPSDGGILERLGLEGRYVLAVSSRSPHKNLAGVQAAMKHVGRSDFTLVFAGGTNRRIFGKSDVLSGDSVVAGRVTDAELRALYESAECFVYPSFYEGFGLPPLEAMACGCPVVVSRAASLPEVCGDAAVYCDAEDPMDIARALNAVLDNNELRGELRRRGRERAARFTWNRAAAALLTLLRALPTR